MFDCVAFSDALCKASIYCLLCGDFTCNAWVDLLVLGFALMFAFVADLL